MRYREWIKPHSQRHYTDDGEGIYNISSLIEKSKNLKVFKYDLKYFDLSMVCWPELSTLEDFICHHKACMEADITKPIIVNYNGRIMDGYHRISRAITEGKKTIPAVMFEEDPGPNFFK